MMRNLFVRAWLLACCLLLGLPFDVCSQDTIQVKRERIFTGSGLYGFMNGGAEQFLEYGVSRLTARDVLYKGEDYSVEIYEMPTPEDAFGIYSLHLFKCQRVDTLGCTDCLSPYQLQAVIGNKYVSVVFPSGSLVGRQGADKLIRDYIPVTGEACPRIPDALELSPPYSGQVKYLRGPIGISGVSTSLAGYLKDCPVKGVWFKQEKGAESYRALIFFQDPADVKRLRETLPASSCLSQGKDFLYIEATEVEAEEDHGDFGF